MNRSFTRIALASAFLPASTWAQGPVFRTPGMSGSSSADFAPPASSDSGQANRFSSVFNPAFSFIVDTLADQVSHSGASDDGVSFDLRALELSAQSWVDPNAWAYFVAATDGESLNVEEAAVHYTGLGGHNTIRAGRFFVDFGKQMQTHVHELRTTERPLVLRTFLGEEVKGDGAQWDSWTSVGDATAVRWSVGVFQNLLPEESDDFDASTQVARNVADRKGAQDLNLTARLTGFTDVGESGVLQLGASARVIPSFAYEFEPSGNERRGQDDTVFGLDATYGWTNATGLASWTFGAEYLIDTGDTYATLDDAGTPGDASDDAIRVASRTLDGFYAYGDYAWDKSNSAGLQFSRVDLPQDGAPSATETTAYYTRSFSEFHRLRFECTAVDRDADEDSMRFAVQYTAFVGAHGHGVNW